MNWYTVPSAISPSAAVIIAFPFPEYEVTRTFAFEFPPEFR